MAIERWNIDTVHSGLRFVARHMVISKVHGTFTRWTGFIMADEQRPTEARVEVRVETASIDTREPQRDAHLRSGDFFDAERFPEMTFRSTRIEKLDDTRYRVTGDLTIRDVTRPVTLEAEFTGRGKDPWGGERVAFSARAAIDRTAFGLKWNQVLESGGWVVGDRIEIEVEIEAVRVPAAVPAA